MIYLWSLEETWPSSSAAAMAVFRCTIFISPPLLPPPQFSGRRVSLKFIRCSSVSPPFPLKSSKRKNYLRPKILRTLNPKPSETSSIDIETPKTVLPSDEFSDQIDGVEEVLVSSSSVVPNELNGMSGMLSPKSVAKYGLYLLGAFAFQTVCAVWFLGNSANSGRTPEISNDSGGSNRRILLNGNGNALSASNVVYLDEFAMNEKIAEIQAMAREARKSEQKGDMSEYDETLSTTGRVDIEKEIGARLSNMEKRLNSQRKGLAGLRVEPLDEFGNGEGKMGAFDIEGNEKSLMFEKKYKFKAEKRPSNAKGFGGSRGNGRSISGSKGTEKGKSERNRKVSDSLNSEKKSEEMQNEKGVADPEINSGAVQETNQRQSSNKVEKWRNSGYQWGEDRDHMERKTASKSHSVSLSSQGNGQLTRKAGETQYDDENGLWWLKLPYVLRILMRGNIDEEVSEGFFTLRTNLAEENEAESSYTVAFEDQQDAKNFCYLLESVFEDLGGFSTDIIPTSTKDLHDEVSSGGKNVIVVKKRQLTLYAGQPFEDVERALRSLIQQHWK